MFECLTLKPLLFTRSGDTQTRVAWIQSSLIPIPGPRPFCERNPVKIFESRHCAIGVASMVVAHALTCGPALAQDLSPIRAELSSVYPDDTRLKERPTEVRIVKVEQMQKNVAGQVALGVLMFALGGGTAFAGSSKDNMKGTTIEPLDDRSNLQIEDAKVFASRLQVLVGNAIQENADWSGKVFKRPVVLAGGVSNLIYEGLTGDEANLYRLKTDWVVYKRKEGFTLFGNPNVVVDCAYSSPTAQSQAAWAENNYAQVKAEMDANIAACEQKVLAAVPDLLKD